MTADEVARKELCLSRVNFSRLLSLREFMRDNNPDENEATLWKSASSLLDLAYAKPAEPIWCSGLEAAWECDKEGEWIPRLSYVVESYTGGSPDAY